MSGGEARRPDSARAVELWLLAQLAEVLGIEPDTIDVHEPFATYGLSSREAVTLSGDLEEWLGRRLPPTLAWEYPTIEALARHLYDTGEESVPAQQVEGRPVAATAENRPADGLVAIIGIGCRFPGADGPDAFWRLLRDGFDAITEVPPDRWIVDEFFDKDPMAPGKMTTRWGGFLQQVDVFDAHFFGISPREAARMDPQQRLLLETAWSALEDAGLVPERLIGSATGVFIGISGNEYSSTQLMHPETIDAYAGTGNALSIAANRLSYYFDFRGPSLALDTACSSSLVAVHLACASLASGECNLALAGGVNLILSPALGINFSKAGAMASDGRCKTFDARADGYVRSEGVGLVVLKPLARALADGDPVYAVILGSAINQDGRTNGLMAPNPHAQESVLREAYRRAGVSPGKVQYVEAHGTGTFVGDPIEARAIGAVLAADRAPDSRCLLGSVKTNIGHAEAAAGVAGLIKTALALKHGKIPPSLHFETPNPHIPFDELSLRVPRALEDWPQDSGRRLAGVSSFGFGGTNAHIVLSNAPTVGQSVVSQDNAAEGGRAYLLPLSARSAEALVDITAACRSFLAGPGAAASLRDICYTASLRRSHHEHHLAVIGRSTQELAQLLEMYLAGEQPSGVHVGVAGKGQQPGVVFVFSGQGGQWAGMGRGLLASEPVFREVLEQCDRLIREAAGWSVLEELAAGEENTRLHDISVLQPTLFAVQAGLAALWQHWGIQPGAVAGHSMGEVAAAYVAGAITLPDAVGIICRRSELLRRTSGQGAMLAVGLSLAEAEEHIKGYGDLLCIAVSNGPGSTVLSGDGAVLQKLAADLNARKVFCRPVKVDVAAHSPQVAPLVPELVAALGDLQPQPARIPLYSTVAGKPIDGQQLDAAYWGRNLRQPVLFATATEQLVRDGYGIFLELSPHPVLLSAIEEQFDALKTTGLAEPSLRRNEDEPVSLLASLASLYARGVVPHWPALYPTGGRHVSLPTNPWQRRRYWLADEATLVASASLSSPRDSMPVVHSDPQDRPEDWLYEVAWSPAAKMQARVSAPRTIRQVPGRWLILADQRGLGRSLARELESRGASCVLLAAGESNGDGQRESRDDYVSNPASFEILRLRLAETLATEGPPWRAIVHLWSLDAASTETLETTPPQDSLSLLGATQHLVTGSALALLQTLAARHGDGSLPSPAIWWVTRGSQAVTESTDVAVAQAPLWGLARTAAVEHPDLWGGLVDLDPVAPEGEAERLCEEIWSPDGEDQLAWRAGTRYVARLRAYRDWEGAGAYRVRSDAAYLITGGLGGLGLQVARWLVEQGARHLVLTGRTGLPARDEWQAVEDGSALGNQVASVRELEALGADIEIIAADVADIAQSSSLLSRFKQTDACPLAGVLHLAGQVDALPLTQLDEAGLQEQLRAKVAGSWLLHRFTKALALDFCVLFSSASSLLGSPFLGGYAAANAFLDALAHYRRSRGAAALSVNWGFWSQTGMVDRYEKQAGRRLVPRGMREFAPVQGLQVLRDLLGRKQAQVAVLRADWQEYLRYHAAAGQTSLLGELRAGLTPWTGITTPSVEPSALTSVRQASSAIQDELSSAPATAGPPSIDALETYLKRVIAHALHLRPHEVNVDQHFAELGLDSLMAMELIRDVERNLGVRLYPREIFEQPTVGALAVYLAAQQQRAPFLRAEEAAAPTTTALQPPAVALPMAFPVALPASFDGRAVGYGVAVEPSPISHRLPGVVFLLSSPRSGSTLLRVMLAGHSRLFCPPELHLLPFRNLSSRREALGVTYLDEGLQRALMELLSLTDDQSKALLDEWVGQNLSIPDVYAKLQELAGDRLLVDKTPSYASNLDTLERAEAVFEDARYLFLVRHPYAVIESFVRNRLDKLVGAGEADPFFLAEQNWAMCNANVLDFLVQVPKERYRIVRYEDLVRDPSAVSHTLCMFLGIPFEPALLKPYEGERMTDGIHAVSMATGDPNFLKHDRIEAGLGEVWRNIKLPRRLGGFARRVAVELQYELPQESSLATRQALAPARQPSDEDGDGWVVSGINAPTSALVPIQPLGDKRPIFLVHSASGIVYSYYELARSLGQDRPVYALQDLSLEGQREPHEQIQDYAEEYMQVIRATQPEGPYLVGGWSFGGHIAIEIARRLKEIGETVALLVVIDSEAPVAGRSLSVAQRVAHVKNTVVEYVIGLPDIVPYLRDGLYLSTEARRSLDDTPETRMSRFEYLQYAWTDAMRRRLTQGAGIREVLARHRQLKRVPLPNATVRRGLHVFRQHLGIVRRFQPEVYPGKITLLRAEQQIRRQYYTDETLGWAGLASGGVDVRSIPGNHVSLFREPHVHGVAAVLRACLDEADAQYGEGRVS